jgi:2-hydroxymuconate-semialdehyde hydrolase
VHAEDRQHRPVPDGRRPLLLLHGGGPGVDARSNWQTVSSRLARRFDVLTPDLLGFGDAVGDAGLDGLPVGPAAWAVARAHQVLALLDARDIDTVAVVGNSAAGGAAALRLLSLAPERVRAAVVMGGAGTGPLPARVPFYGTPTRESMRATLANLVADEAEHVELLDDLADLRLRQALQPGAERAFRAMFEPDPPEAPRLDPAAITCPVLALHGELDRVAPVEVSQRLVDSLPGAELAVVAGAGHWIHVDRPESFCTHVEEFLGA